MSDPSSPAEPATSSPLDFAWQHCATLPHGLDVGMKILSAGDARAEMSLTTGSEHEAFEGSGLTQGALLYSLADTCSGLSVFAASDAFVVVATLDMRMEYLTSVRTGSILIARAHCHTLRSDLAFARCDVFDQRDVLVGASSATFVRRPRTVAAQFLP